jgi:hypothetical protein
MAVSTTGAMRDNVSPEQVDRERIFTCINLALSILGARAHIDEGRGIGFGELTRRRQNGADLLSSLQDTAPNRNADEDEALTCTVLESLLPHCRRIHTLF